MRRGTIHQGDLVNQQDIRELRVGDIMQSNWPTLNPEQTVEDVIKLFAESGI